MRSEARPLSTIAPTMEALCLERLTATTLVCWLFDGGRGFGNLADGWGLASRPQRGARLALWGCGFGGNAPEFAQ